MVTVKQLHESLNRLYEDNNINSDYATIELEFSVSEDELPFVINTIKEDTNLDIEDITTSGFNYFIIVSGRKTDLIDYITSSIYGLEYEEAEEYYPELFESLTEAVNHENDEINALIRKYVGKKNIPAKARKAIEDAGITIDNKWDEISFEGPNGRRLGGSGRTYRTGPMAPQYHYKDDDFGSYYTDEERAKRKSTKRE